MSDHGTDEADGDGWTLWGSFDEPVIIVTPQEWDRLRGLLARALPWIDPNDSHEDYLLTVEIRKALGEGT